MAGSDPDPPPPRRYNDRLMTACYHENLPPINTKLPMHQHHHPNNSHAQLSRKSVDFQVPRLIPFGLACISAMHFASHTASSTVSSRLKGGDSRPANTKPQRGMSNMDLKRPNIVVV
ncbi:unnamed protein product [Fusarium graminearum]|uniref:Chromosome 3, complete genome n=1 Tax=Gibberella zeae (strain ATCC MYA-4620 / CBS 123657 / FGSC 9075 / NRRL 31084 / PH-1) TaxID=229533 RepID=I1RME0_GIBZE|nr:hypothetical protein FGSG_05129 [Fusarium graminearum PH-1]ESU11051.1 hypothetical protein FGSG_05129 [Fusarium graminearum PH-1]EYB31878.1 hypothetical protein FG05_05129 [Fusarium graminearum]CEF86124.1 unnamed protein product [Fusarium graminearum]CZS83695.1 unnamed protein product [Fusarium graminearum]|eukprot:XP_011323627.1 hypothetical protein FGSG_05129 [Fusarium graminearum PH-1]